MNSAPVRDFADPEAHRWNEDNQRGLALAAVDDWAGATGAFAAAAESLATNEARDPAVHEALALVLSNLAQAQFHLGDTDDAIRHAQRVCALRAALCGEDAVAVARSRSDLAVMLASTGRLDEAPALIARAIAGIEHSVGDEDLLLAVVLENAARVALATGQPASAEPHLLRLHALLGGHELSTERADILLAQVADARADAELRSEVEQPAGSAPPVPESFSAPRGEPVAESFSEPVAAAFIEPVPDSSGEPDVALDVALDVASVAEAPDDAPLQSDDIEWDDQPLRDAVVLTDVLLRSTPSGSPVVRAESNAIDPWAAAPVSEMPVSETPVSETPVSETPADDELIATAPAVSMADQAVEQQPPRDTTADHLDLIGDDEIFGASGLELTDALEAPAAGRSPEPADAGAVDSVPGNMGRAGAPRIERNVPVDRDNGLGFVVQYGTPLESGTHRALPDHAFMPSPARSSDAIAREAAEGSAMMESDDEQIDVLTPPETLPAIDQEAVVPSTDAFDIGMVELTLADAPPATPADAILAKPLPPVDGSVTRPAREETIRRADESADARLAAQSVPRSAPPGQSRRAPRVAGADATKSRMPMIGGGIGAIVLAIAGWWYMSGGF